MPLPEPILITVAALLGLGAVAWMLCALEPMVDWLGTGSAGLDLRLDLVDMKAANEELVSR